MSTTSELFPEPDTPVTQVSVPSGTDTSTCCRLLCRAPRISTRQPAPGRSGPFDPVWALATAPAGRADCLRSKVASTGGDGAGTVALRLPVLLAGTDAGVFKSADGAHFEPASSREFRERVTLPDTWLFCSGEHEVSAVSEDEVQ